MIWGSDDDNPTASLLLRSMGYRDALVGGMLMRAGLRGTTPRAGSSPVVGPTWPTLSGPGQPRPSAARSRTIGLGGAIVGIAVGVAGAQAGRRRRTP